MNDLFISIVKKGFVSCLKQNSQKFPWRKYRIEINSKSIRTIPIHSDICIRANANNAEPIRKTFCISFDEKRSKINPT